MEGTQKKTASFDTIDTFLRVVKMAEMSKMSSSVRTADFSMKKKSITQRLCGAKSLSSGAPPPKSPPDAAGIRKVRPTFDSTHSIIQS